MGWARLENLYRRARQGSYSAYHELFDSVVPNLARWVSASLPGVLSLREFEEVAERALIETFVHWSTIPSWPEAWSFAQTVAKRLSVRESKKKLRVGVFNFDTSRLEAPRSAGTAIHSMDAIESLEKRLAARAPEDIAVLRSILYGTPTVVALARQRHVSVATIKRRRRALREWVSRKL